MKGKQERNNCEGETLVECEYNSQDNRTSASQIIFKFIYESALDFFFFFFVCIYEKKVLCVFTLKLSVLMGWGCILELCHMLAFSWSEIYCKEFKLQNL